MGLGRKVIMKKPTHKRKHPFLHSRRHRGNLALICISQLFAQTFHLNLT